MLARLLGIASFGVRPLPKFREPISQLVSHNVSGLTV